MKKILVFTFLITAALFSFAQEVSDLGITGEYYDIRSDNTGAIHILWMDLGTMKYGQIVNRQVVNQETIPVLSRGEVNYRKFRPRLSVRPDGSSVHFAWVTPASGPRTLRHCWRNASGTWAVENVYTTSTKYLEYPAITVDGTGMVHATVMSWVWSSDLHPVHYFRKPVGGAWTQESNLAAANAKHLWCTLYTDTSGNVHATWDRNKAVVQYRYAASGGSLADSSTVTLPTSWSRNKESEVAVDSLGNVHVTAMAYNDPGAYIGYDYWYKPVGGSFQTPLRATDNDFFVESYFPYPAILGETQNMVAVSWAEPANGLHQSSDTIRVATYNGTDWVRYTLDTTADLKENTRTAMARNSSSAYMVWRNGGDTLSLATFDFASSGLISPNGGEVWEWGDTHDITWNMPDATGNFDIHLYKNDIDLGPIVSDIPNNGSYAWTINTLEDGTMIQADTDYKIEVKAIDGSESDISYSDFTITTVLKVITPNSSSVWTVGQTYDITWTTPAGASSNVKINIFKDTTDVSNFVEQLTGPNNGSMSWTIPANYVEGNYIMRLKTDDNLLFDDSDLFFIQIDPDAPPSITVSSPGAGAAWYRENSYDITWARSGVQTTNVNIGIYEDAVDPSNLLGQITTENDGLYNWTIPAEAPDGSYIIRVETTDEATHGDSGLFTITGDPNAPPSITITSPADGDTWSKNSTYDITWNRNGTLSANVKVNIFINNTDPSNFVEQLTSPNSGSISWTIPGTYVSGTYIIRVKTDDNQVFDDSDLFNINDGGPVTPEITVQSPSAGSTWYKDRAYDITWTSTGSQTADVNIDIYRDAVDPGNFVEQVTTANDGSHNWTIPGTYTSGSYILRIETTDAATHGDSGVFSIDDAPAAEITVISPAQCSAWSKGNTYIITWLKEGTMSANVEVDIFKDTTDPSNFMEQLTGPNSGSISWAVPAAYENGNYIVRITTDDGLVTDDSGLFTINATAIASPAIVVTSPVSCDSWGKETTYKITWLKNGTMDSNVKVNIFRDNTDPASFVQQLTGPNSGSIDWAIPADYVNGNYVIRIKTADNRVVGDSELFEVTDGGPVSPTITVDSPAAGVTWYKDQSYNITWSTTGSQTSNVNIDVYLDAVDPGNFIEQIVTANDGSHNWTVPGSYSDGNYILRIETTDGATHGDSGLFTVTDSSGAASITVVSPSQCSSWSRGNTYVITWLAEGSMSSNVKINIFRNTTDPSNFVEQITGPNSGSAVWSIGAGYATGNYILRIKTDDNLVFGDSPVFTIDSTSVPSPSIIVTSPTACDTWNKLKTYKITWSKTGTMSSNVKVNIFRNNTDPANFVEQLTGPNTGSIDWTISGAYTSGNYIIRIKTDDNVVRGDSGLFAITD